jgi:hypothetical protein
MKPTDLFIGVTDFFSVLLPGSLLTWFCQCYSYQTCLELKLPVCLPQERSEQIALFLATSYIVGNLLFIVASQLDNWFYDKFRNWKFNKNKDLCFQTEKLIRDEYINAPKLIDELLERTYIKLENPNEKHTYKEIFNTYKWALCFIGAKNPDLLVDVKKYEADSKFFRSLVVGFIIVAFAVLLKENNGILFVGLIILSFLSFYRYADLRHKSTEKAYQLIVTLHHLEIVEPKIEKPSDDNKN